jgi:hypothetical protein
LSHFLSVPISRGFLDESIAFFCAFLLCPEPALCDETCQEEAVRILNKTRIGLHAEQNSTRKAAGHEKVVHRSV